jgi:hypothetical protein
MVFLFICLTVSILNGRFEVNESFVRIKQLDPKNNKNIDKTISIYAVTIDDENFGKCKDKFKTLPINDNTCLHRVYGGSMFVLKALTDTVVDDNKFKEQLLSSPDVPFVDVLEFDAFVNPKLYSLICNNDKENVAKKIVYFNSSHNRAPVAGCYKKSYVSTTEYEYLKTLIKNNMQNKEQKSMKDDKDFLDAALCFNSDYKDLLKHVREMQKEANYQFSCVTTRFGGQKGHGLAMVVNKQNNEVQLIGMDGANVLTNNCGFNLFGKIIDLLNNMIISPEVLENMIVRYVCATKSDARATEEIKELGLSENALYKASYCGFFKIEELELGASNEELIIPRNCSHAVFRIAELSLGENINNANVDLSNEQLKQPFLNSLRYAANLDAQAYALVCGDAQQPHIRLDDNNNKRSLFKTIASQIVYMKRIIDAKGRELFSEDSEFKKLLQLRKLNDEKSVPYVIVTNLSNNQNAWNAIVVKSEETTIFNTFDYDTKQSFVDLLKNEKKLKEQIQESLFYHYSKEIAQWHYKGLESSNNILDDEKPLPSNKFSFKQFFTVRIASIGLCICIVGTLIHELVKKGYFMAVFRLIKI